MIPNNNPFRQLGNLEIFIEKYTSISEDDKKPLITWFDKFEKELKKLGTNYQKSNINPTDALELYYDNVKPKEAAVQLKENVGIEERTSPLPKATAFSLLFSYAGKDHKFVSKLTDIGGKLDRKKKEVYFDFTSAAARTKFRKKHKDIIKSLSESYLYEASPKIKYAKIMKGIRDAQGPFSVVAIKNGKVVAQKNSIKNSKMLPIEVNDMADAHAWATISIEGKGGKILNTFKESYLYEASQRFGGDTNIPADKKTKGYIESGRAKILINVPSTLNKTARFVVAKNPNTGSNQDKVMMFTISDPDRGRIKMFAFHGTHVSHQKAMDFAKKHKLVARKDAKGRPLYAKESVELDERTKTRTFEFPDNRKAKQFAKDISNSSVATGTVSGNRVIDVELLHGNPGVANKVIQRMMKMNRGKELKESVELDEAKDFRRELEKRHAEAIKIIWSIDTTFGRTKWTDSFGNYVTKDMPDEIDTSIDAGWSYHQNRGRGEWFFTIEPKDVVKYSYTGNAKINSSEKSGRLKIGEFTQFVSKVWALTKAKNESVEQSKVYTKEEQKLLDFINENW